MRAQCCSINRWIQSVALAAALAFALLAAGGCLGISWQTQKTPSIHDPSLTTGTASSTSLSAPTTTKPTTTAKPTILPYVPASFTERIQPILLSGLRDRQREIALDQAIRLFAIPEDDVQKVISQVFKTFQMIYLAHPEYFYLSGSINVSYSLRVGLTAKQLQTMTVKPVYWDSTEELSDLDLDELVRAVDSKASQMATRIMAESEVPFERLRLLHDQLIHEIAYDTSGELDNNQAAAALLDGQTLCQGYAQSFQMVAAKMGFQVCLITGTVDAVGHVWNLVWLDGQPYHVDVTHDDPTPDGGAQDPVEHVHFMRSDAAMRETHIWEAADFPACATDGAHYYRKNSLTVGSASELKATLKRFTSKLKPDAAGASMLELLYTASDIPSEKKLADLVRDALASAPGFGEIHYRYLISKSVIIVEVNADR